MGVNIMCMICSCFFSPTKAAFIKSKIHKNINIVNYICKMSFIPLMARDPSEILKICRYCLLLSALTRVVLLSIFVETMEHVFMNF